MRWVRSGVVAGWLVAGCGQDPRPTTGALPANRTPTAVAAPIDAMPATTTQRSSDGTCVPLPREGQPCGEGDSWCVISWGVPGGFSVALWCRQGRWEREEEVNLP